MKKYITIFFLLFALAKLSYSQTFPVSASTQLTPPYSIYLADYVAPGSNRLALNIFLGDINRPELQTRLRLRIEGQGILLETKPEFLPPPLILQGGVPERLIATDLADYFRPENLNFQGITRQEFERTGTLPEGLYQFCFEVLEYNRGVTISNRACAMAWLILNDPPLINLPRNEEKIRPQDPQYVTFQWTPRHTASPNSAFTTEYDFSLVEIWPDGRNPNDAILTTPPIFETTTQSTTLIYGPAETPLVLGRKYAFRVRARSIVGVEQLDLFKNNGYSQTATFQYGDPCNFPVNISAKSSNSGGFEVAWEPIYNHTSFSVRYRKANDQQAEWYEEDTFFDKIKINGLQAETTYEYQVSGGCGGYSSEYSPIGTVTTDAAPEVNYNCGLSPVVYDLQNTTLVASLQIGDIINAGDFDVKITEVQPFGNGYSGKGNTLVPFLDNLTVSVDFDNIQVNDEYRMISGFMNVRGVGLDILPGEISSLIDDLNQKLDDLEEVLDDVDSVLDKVDDIIEIVDDVSNFLDDYLPDDIKEEIRIAKEELANAKDKVRNASTPEDKEAAKVEVKDAKKKLKDSVKKALDFYAQALKDIVRILKESIQELVAGSNQETKKVDYETIKNEVNTALNIDETQSGANNGSLILSSDFEVSTVDESSLSANSIDKKIVDMLKVKRLYLQAALLAEILSSFSGPEDLKLLAANIKTDGVDLLKMIGRKLKDRVPIEDIKTDVKAELSAFVNILSGNLNGQ